MHGGAPVTERWIRPFGIWLIAGATVVSLASCSAQPNTHTTPSVTDTTAASAAPEPQPTLSVPPIADGEITRTELFDGRETPAPSSPVSLDGAAYYAVGECRGTGDLTEIPYTVTIDGEVVTEGAIACRSGRATRDSAFQDITGSHDVAIRFAEGVDPAVSGYVIITSAF